MFRTVHSEDYCTSQDYEYDKIKQALRIKDLKRYSINGILVDNYSDMTEILTKIENSFRRNTVFVSGSAHEYGKWGTDNSLKFMHTLASRLSSKEYRIVSGFGLGVGTAVINGCLDYVYSSNYRHLDEYLVLRPFPQIATGAKSKEKLWEEYRRDMMTEAGTAVFLFGHKANVDGKPVDADGVYKEFDIARKLRLKPIPVGATGFASKRLWEKVMSEFDTFYADYPQLRPDFEVLGKEDESHDKLIGTILKILDAIRGG